MRDKILAAILIIAMILVIISTVNFINLNKYYNNSFIINKEPITKEVIYLTQENIINEQISNIINQLRPTYNSISVVELENYFNEQDEAKQKELSYFDKLKQPIKFYNLVFFDYIKNTGSKNLYFFYVSEQAIEPITKIELKLENINIPEAYQVDIIYSEKNDYSSFKVLLFNDINSNINFMSKIKEYNFKSINSRSFVDIEYLNFLWFEDFKYNYIENSNVQVSFVNKINNEYYNFKVGELNDK